MSKTLKRDLNFSYTIEELELLKDIYLTEIYGEWDEEYYMPERRLHEIGVEGFIDWLSKEDRRKLL